MAITVKFVTGEQRKYNGSVAVVSGPVFLLRKRNKGKLETSKAFPADQIVWARLPNGAMVAGKGKVDSK
jgi:hypothetical protein